MMEWVAPCMLLGVFLLIWFTCSFTKKRRREAAEHLEYLQRSRVDLLPQGVAPGDNEEIARRVYEIMAKVAECAISDQRLITVNPDRLRPDDRLIEELGYDLDSFAFFDFVLRLETEFDLHLGAQDWNEIRTVGEVVRLVVTHLNAR